MIVRVKLGLKSITEIVMEGDVVNWDWYFLLLTSFNSCLCSVLPVIETSADK